MKQSLRDRVTLFLVLLRRGVLIAPLMGYLLYKLEVLIQYILPMGVESGKTEIRHGVSKNDEKRVLKQDGITSYADYINRNDKLKIQLEKQNQKQNKQKVPEPFLEHLLI